MSIRDLIDSWSTISQFANDIGCGYEAARKMRARNSIAPEHWANVLQAAKKKELPWVTIDWLIANRSRLNTNEHWPDGIARPDVEDKEQG